jgi:hypothetical protein
MARRLQGVLNIGGTGGYTIYASVYDNVAKTSVCSSKYDLRVLTHQVLNVAQTGDRWKRESKACRRILEQTRSRASDMSLHWYQ